MGLLMELDGFDGKVALVSGGARGIGAEIAGRLSALGAKVAIGDIVEGGTRDLLHVQLDVSSEASVVEGVRQVADELGPPTILVLNAGIFPIEPIEDMTLTSWQRTIDVNLTGNFLLARQVLPFMRNEGYGRLVSLGSSAGVTGGSGDKAAYAASKAGLMALTKAIASDYAKFGVVANTIAPSLINTEMVGGISHLADSIPVGRLGEPEDIADLVAFLCSSHCGFITGATIDINGGYLIR